MCVWSNGSVLGLISGGKVTPSLSGLCLFFVLMWFPCCICPQSRCLHGATLPSPAVMRTYWKQEASVTGMSPPPSTTGTWGVAAAAAAAGVQTPHWSLKHLNSLNPTFISPPHFGPLTPPYSLAPLPHTTLQADSLCDGVSGVPPSNGMWDEAEDQVPVGKVGWPLVGPSQVAADAQTGPRALWADELGMGSQTIVPVPVTRGTHLPCHLWCCTEHQ